MEITKIIAHNKVCFVYDITYQNTPFRVGDKVLNGIINQSILNETYINLSVKVNDETIAICDLDDTIYCFLGEYLTNPTERDIIENVEEILNEYFI